MRLAGTETTADLHNKGSSVLPKQRIFPLTGRQRRVHILQLLRGDKGHVGRQRDGKLRKAHAQCVIGIANGFDNGADDQLQVLRVAALPRDDLFPVPLIDIQ